MIFLPRLTGELYLTAMPCTRFYCHTQNSWQVPINEIEKCAQELYKINVYVRERQPSLQISSKELSKEKIEIYLHLEKNITAFMDDLDEHPRCVDPRLYDIYYDLCKLQTEQREGPDSLRDDYDIDKQNKCNDFITTLLPYYRKEHLNETGRE